MSTFSYPKPYSAYQITIKDIKSNEVIYMFLSRSIGSAVAEGIKLFETSQNYDYISSIEAREIILNPGKENEAVLFWASVGGETIINK